MINNGKFHISPKDISELELIQRFLADVAWADGVSVEISNQAKNKAASLKQIVENAEWFS